VDDTRSTAATTAKIHAILIVILLGQGAEKGSGKFELKATGVNATKLSGTFFVVGG
jgi:hypothetical protein